MIINEDKFCYLNLKLPIHLRYHKNFNDSSSIFHLNDPKILISCQNEKVKKINVGSNKLPCDATNNLDCVWNEIGFIKVGFFDS